MHSLLFVPARKKMLQKITGSQADACIIDLEDAILPEDKEAALEELIAFLREFHAEKIYVRLDGRHIQRQIAALQGLAFAGYMLPKFETPEVFEQWRDLLAEKQVIALVETPKGAVNIERIVQCPWVNAVAFGAEDYTSCTGMTNSPETLHYVKSRIVMYCKAYEKPVYDTPSFILDDMEMLRTEAERALDMGFEGKLAIHPKQITVINQVFTACDAEYLASIIAQYESGGEAVLKIDGKVYEKMHIAHMKRILKEKKG